jgi:hypothetical protein
MKGEHSPLYDLKSGPDTKQSLSVHRESEGESSGIPLKPHGTPGQAKDSLTPISCHAVLERSTCAPFIKERRKGCINATNLRRKSGQIGHPAFVAGGVETQYCLITQSLALRSAARSLYCREFFPADCFSSFGIEAGDNGKTSTR